MVVQKTVLIILMKSDVKDSENIEMMSFHCIIHQENFYKKPLSNFYFVRTAVTKIVNIILSKGLITGKFQQFPE